MTRPDRGMTLVETAAALAIGALILGLVFTPSVLLLRQQQETSQFNQAKQTVLKISDTLAAKMQDATQVQATWTGTSVTFVLDTGDAFSITKNAVQPPQWDVVYQGSDGRQVSLGTVGFTWEDQPQASPPVSVDHLVLTLWQSYRDDLGRLQKFVVTSGYHVSVAR